jgi:hypothetical protein
MSKAAVTTTKNARGKECPALREKGLNLIRATVWPHCPCQLGQDGDGTRWLKVWYVPPLFHPWLFLVKHSFSGDLPGPPLLRREFRTSFPRIIVHAVLRIIVHADPPFGVELVRIIVHAPPYRTYKALPVFLYLQPLTASPFVEMCKNQQSRTTKYARLNSTALREKKEPLWSRQVGSAPLTQLAY